MTLELDIEIVAAPAYMNKRTKPKIPDVYLTNQRFNHFMQLSKDWDPKVSQRIFIACIHNHRITNKRTEEKKNLFGVNSRLKGIVCQFYKIRLKA